MTQDRLCHFKKTGHPGYEDHKGHAYARSRVLYGSSAVQDNPPATHCPISGETFKVRTPVLVRREQRRKALVKKKRNWDGKVTLPVFPRKPLQTQTQRELRQIKDKSISLTGGGIKQRKWNTMPKLTTLRRSSAPSRMCMDHKAQHHSTSFSRCHQPNQSEERTLHQPPQPSIVGEDALDSVV